MAAAAVEHRKPDAISHRDELHAVLRRIVPGRPPGPVPAPLFMPQLSPSPVFRPGFNPIFVLSHSRYRLPRTMGKLWKLEDKYYVPQAAPAMPGIPRMPRRKR